MKREYILPPRAWRTGNILLEMRLTPRSLWPLMDSPVARDCRARLFLRLLSVNPAPMEQIVQTDMQRALRQVQSSSCGDSR
jgi:hypothetical protein